MRAREEDRLNERQLLALLHFVEAIEEIVAIVVEKGKGGHDENGEEKDSPLIVGNGPELLPSLLLRSEEGRSWSLCRSLGEGVSVVESRDSRRGSGRSVTEAAAQWIHKPLAERNRRRSRCRRARGVRSWPLWRRRLRFGDLGLL